MSNKLKNTRMVTFKEDYFSAPGKEKPIYTKGSTHAIHKDVVASLRDKGAKMDVATVDVEQVHSKMKREYEASLA